MRLPFVSRATYDQHTQVLIDAQGALIQQCDWLRDSYHALLDKYHAIKVAGGSIAEPLTSPEPDLPPDILMRAIREVSPQQDHAYRMNFQWAMSLKDHWQDETYMRRAAAQIRRGTGPLDSDTDTDQD